jgi:DNA-binding transcriptional MerR regulator
VQSDQMSIGEFARHSRLSPKALRLYDELGLLVPTRVDDDSGYRYYWAAQLEHARLIAALRQLQIPLAEIKRIVDLEPEAAADRITEHWNAIETQHTARRDLAWDSVVQDAQMQSAGLARFRGGSDVAGLDARRARQHQVNDGRGAEHEVSAAAVLAASVGPLKEEA